MLLSQAFNAYVQDRIVFANKSVKTEESYKYALKSLVGHIGYDPELADVGFQDIRSWCEALKKRGLVSGTIRGYVVCVRAVMGYMQLLGKECLSPDLVPIPERIDATPTFLTPDEVSHLIVVVGQTRNCSKLIVTRNQAIIALLYSSGIRVSELCSLNRDDVNGEVFTVLGKGNKRRPCMIDARARKLIDEYLRLRIDGAIPLFTDNMNGTRLKPGTLQSLFRRLNTRSGIKKQIHPHTMRHSLANDLMRKGCHIYPLSRIMGHSNISTTQQYFQMYDPELVEVHKKYHTI